MALSCSSLLLSLLCLVLSCFSPFCSCSLVEHLPLRTAGNAIVDAKNNTVRIAGVNWYGTDQLDFVVGGLHVQPLQGIVKQIVSLGFNAVRLPWSNQMVETNPIIQNKVLAANPSLQGKRALDILDILVDTLASSNILIMLDNHMSRADWCCNNNDGNGLWYNANYTLTQWQADWRFLVSRYKNIPQVALVDLRNELRQSCTSNGCVAPNWGGTDKTNDWRAAASTMGNMLLEINSNLLIVVEGLNYALDLSFLSSPAQHITLSLPNRLVYSCHNYEWDQSSSSYENFASTLDHNWGFIVEQKNSTCYNGRVRDMQ
eukprot:TRINITY_DN8178_c0_g1_i1.p1 TRINITY_DN8178_c0_g1~~TRINITY_DN8178_c0_g1_i1.p1  ORF type:complete len:330 (-),score=24.07 TRINITY_DN8178_c0_g1_i1:355-1302(-)